MKDYHDMLSSLKDKVIGAAGKATVAVTDAAGKVSETVTDAASKVVSDEMRDKVAGAAHTVDADVTIEPEDIEVEVTEEPAPEE